MKTIKEIADEIGVTKQAIFYRIGKPPLLQALKPLVSRENGVLMVSNEAEKLIKQAFDVHSTAQKPSKFEKVTELLYGTTDALIAQLEQKDKQIADLASTVKALSKSIITLSKPKPQKRKTQVKQGKMSAPIERLINQKPKTCSLPKQHRKARKPR